MPSHAIPPTLSTTPLTPIPTLHNVQYGSCELLHSAEVAAGEGPAYGNSGFDEVPVISGWASQGVTPAAEKAPATNPVATAGR